jgi:hypothetical protein
LDSEGHLPIERELRLRLDALGDGARAELLRVLDLPDEERAQVIKTLYDDPRLQPMAELLMDLEIDPAGRAKVIVELRIMGRRDD